MRPTRISVRLLNVNSRVTVIYVKIKWFQTNVKKVTYTLCIAHFLAKPHGYRYN
jgi:hypothetical protein